MSPPPRRCAGRVTFARLDCLLDWLRLEEPALFKRRFRVALTVGPGVISCAGDSFEYLLGKGVGEIAISPAMGGAVRWTASDREKLDEQVSRIFSPLVDHYQRIGRVPLLTVPQRN